MTQLSEIQMPVLGDQHKGEVGTLSESIEERCFSAALICLEGHFTQSPPMGPLTAARVGSMVSKTLEKTHALRKSREALSRNVAIWIWLTRIFAAAIPSLTTRSVGPLSSLNDPDKGVSPQESTALIVMNYHSITEDLGTLIKLMHIARNLLVNADPEVPQDICAAVHFDQMVYQTIILCVNVTSKGYDGEILDEAQRLKLQDITESYKKLLVTSLQQAHNWTAKHDRNKMSFWFDVLFDEDYSVYEQLPYAEIGIFRPEIAKQQVQHWLERNSRMCDAARKLLKEYAQNKADRPPGNLALVRPLAWNWLPEGSTKMPDLVDSGKESISPVWKPEEKDRFEQDRAYGRVSREIDTWWLGARDPNYENWTVRMPSVEFAESRTEHCKSKLVHRYAHSYRGILRSPPPNAADDASVGNEHCHHCPECFKCHHHHDEVEDEDEDEDDEDDDDGDDEEGAGEGEGENEGSGEKQKAESQGEDPGHAHQMEGTRGHEFELDDDGNHNLDLDLHRHHYDHVHDDARVLPFDMDQAQDCDCEEEHSHEHEYGHEWDVLADDDDVDDDESYGEGPLTGLLTEVPNILDPKQIEALHMIVKSCILDNAGSGLTRAGENLQKTRCRMFIALECGQALLRELLVFIAVWEKDEQSLIFQVTTQIVEALHHSALIPYTWNCLRQPKDIVSPAQTVLLRLVSHMFRVRVASINKTARVRGPLSSPAAAPTATSSNDKNDGTASQEKDASRDIKLIHFFYSFFRTRMVPECAALMFLQAQIRNGKYEASEFPVDSWDMERAKEGLSQYLDFLTVVSELADVRVHLIEWEAVFDLIAILDGLEAGVEKKPLSELPKRSSKGSGATSSTDAAATSATTAPPLTADEQSVNPMVERPYATGPSSPPPSTPPPHNQEAAHKFPWPGVKGQIFTILATLLQPPAGQHSPGNPLVQAQMLKYNGIVPLLNSCAYDDHNPFAKERVAICLKWLLDGSDAVNQFFRELKARTPRPNLKPQPGESILSMLKIDGIEGNVKVKVRPSATPPGSERDILQRAADLTLRAAPPAIRGSLEDDFMA